MKILITGANGYIGRRLIPILLEQEHMLYACVRDASRFDLAGGHYGCFQDVRTRNVGARSEAVWQRVWKIGGDTGWYYADWLWELRGLLDKMAGGVGLNRGRTRTNDIETGDALDFWRVLVADKAGRRLLLFAEMRLPGEAWLEFKIISTSEGDTWVQTATFRPRGLLGRLYWYIVLPLHGVIFNGMIHAIAEPPLSREHPPASRTARKN